MDVYYQEWVILKITKKRGREEENRFLEKRVISNLLLYNFYSVY